MAEDVRSRILRAFDAIVLERSGEKLTVKALIERAGISRQTFYYYFEDIMDVLDFVFQGGLQTSLKRCATATSTAQTIQFYLEDFLKFENVWPRLVGAGNGWSSSSTEALPVSSSICCPGMPITDS